MKTIIPVLIFLLASIIDASHSHAHFLWLVPVDESGERVTLYFSEGPEPDNPALLKRVDSVKAIPYRTSEPDDAVPFQFDEAQTRLVANQQGASAWTLTHQWGVHGRDEKNLIVYTAASVACRRPGMDDKDAVSLPRAGFTAEPMFDGEKLTIQVWLDDKPAANMDIELQSPNDHRSLRTDGTGCIEAKNIASGIYAIRCLKTDESPGELQGVAYKAIKRYTTVSFIVPTLKRVTLKESSEDGVLPEPITSFGATTIDGALYALGGHTGGAHSYSLEEQFNKLIRLDLKNSKGWEVITEGPRVQGNALVGLNSKVILVGGFSAENAKGEKSRFVSKAVVQQYDLKEGKWQELPSLPEPRSSMDATVLDGNLYAIGGWAMSGDSEESKWHKTAWRLPLDKDGSSWQPIAEPPFRRRALAVVAHAGRVFVIGGMNEDGGPTTETCAYNPADNSWEKLGSIAGVPMNGFGAAATELDGKLLVSTVDGSIQLFDDQRNSWKIIGQIPTGRFFHRILPLSADTVAIIGGANMNVGKFRKTEFLTITSEKITPSR